MDDLHYIDYHARKVIPVPHTDERSKDDRFYTSRRAALIVLREYLEEIMAEAGVRWRQVDKEIENETFTHK